MIPQRCDRRCTVCGGRNSECVVKVGQKVTSGLNDGCPDGKGSRFDLGTALVAAEVCVSVIAGLTSSDENNSRVG